LDSAPEARRKAAPNSEAKPLFQNIPSHRASKLEHFQSGAERSRSIEGNRVMHSVPEDALDEASLLIRELSYIDEDIVFKKALADVLQNPSTDLPASGIHPVKGSPAWMVDASAASLLQTGE
jgi:hypothetical protein